MLDLKSIICAGYSCILHLQAMSEEVREHVKIADMYASGAGDLLLSVKEMQNVLPKT